MPSEDSIKFWIHPVLDAQRLEILNILLLRDKRAVQINDFWQSDFCVIDASLMKDNTFKLPPGKKIIALCPGDLAANYVGLRPDDWHLRYKFIRDKNIVIYLVIETEPVIAGQLKTLKVARIRLNSEHENVHILTTPMGYFAGSKQNINYLDDDESAFFVKTSEKNQKNYKWDWCWIGTESSRQRISLLERLKQLVNERVFWHSEAVNTSKDREERRKRLHADNRKIPYLMFLDIHRKSKVCISCNGWGMWCYKDAELLSRNCFILRQDHKNLNINRLSPVSGKHWVIGKDEEIPELLKYYIENDEERERINDQGYEYFVKGINGGWAKEYVSGLQAYLQNGDTTFNGLRFASC